ncbi:hypothetical protein E1J29_19950 [Xanthomonas hortorum pv. vitians]|nr:hypothetical protein [Xanthomonas hortorum pv. vitians]QEW17306.1 hypothetical protein DYQ48_22490 [Xanthomonas hortorum]NMI28639.1 hypothetical protein [Xanthomonas hortorum pv. vitians]NMI34712.1 hypothetical protein [Xanthomonas hortorum pv. vitians]NMI41341.1 hypothetical protein [Xanthomonas hortorum pv. vitians]
MRAVGARALERPRLRRGPGRGAGVGVRVRPPTRNTPRERINHTFTAQPNRPLGRTYPSAQLARLRTAAPDCAQRTASTRLKHPQNCKSPHTLLRCGVRQMVENA